MGAGQHPEMIQNDDKKVLCNCMNTRLSLLNFIQHPNDEAVQLWSSDKEIKFVGTYQQSIDDIVFGYEGRTLMLMADGSCIGRGGLEMKSDISINAKLIYGGLVNEHFFAVTRDERLLAIGLNQKHQFGKKTKDQRCTEWIQIDFQNWPKNIKTIATGIYCSHFLSKKGEIFTAGYSWSGALGLGENVQQSPQLITPIPIKQRFRKIECGNSFCVAVDNAQRLWSWGWKRNGRCGQGHTNDIWVPTLIKSMADIQIADISIGFKHSLALDVNNKVLCCFIRFSLSILYIYNNIQVVYFWV